MHAATARRSPPGTERSEDAGGPGREYPLLQSSFRQVCGKHSAVAEPPRRGGGEFVGRCVDRPRRVRAAAARPHPSAGPEIGAHGT